MNTETKLKQLLELVLKTEIMRNEHQKRLRKSLQTRDEQDIKSARLAEAVANEVEKDLFTLAHRTKVEMEKLNSLQRA